MRDRVAGDGVAGQVAAIGLVLAHAQVGLGAQILSSLGLSRLVLLTNSPPPKVVGLDAYGLSIAGTRAIPLD